MTARHVHTIPVPRSMSVDEAWAEMCTVGRLLEPDPHCTWANVECDGECVGIEKAPDFRHFHNDVLIEGPPMEES